MHGSNKKSVHFVAYINLITYFCYHILNIGKKNGKNRQA